MYYDDKIARCARRCGFKYARISEETGDYTVPDERYRWKGSKFHWDADLEEFVDGFLGTDRELALCQLVGHSYDLDVMDAWERMEDIFRKVSSNDDVAAMTNQEIVRYLDAMEASEITDEYIRNNSPMKLWFRIDEDVISVDPGRTYMRKD